MNRQISFAQYRAIDLGIMAVLMIFSQAVISIAFVTIYADQLYVVSTVGAVVGLVMMRWNGWAAIHAVLGGLLYALLSGGSAEHYLIYGAGNLLALLGLLVLTPKGKEYIRNDGLMTLFFGAGIQVLMQLGRAGVALILGHPAAVCIGFITTDALSILFTAVILWVSRRIEGLFEDQKKYLLRIQKEHKS